ncbi:hypothetical protein D3C71_1848120 [compost metagenome]
MSDSNLNRFSRTQRAKACNKKDPALMPDPFVHFPRLPEQALPIRPDHLFVPMERLLAVPRKRSRSVVMTVDIDEAVTLLQLRS